MIETKNPLMMLVLALVIPLVAGCPPPQPPYHFQVRLALLKENPDNTYSKLEKDDSQDYIAMVGDIIEPVAEWSNTASPSAPPSWSTKLPSWDTKVEFELQDPLSTLEKIDERRWRAIGKGRSHWVIRASSHLGSWRADDNLNVQ